MKIELDENLIQYRESLRRHIAAERPAVPRLPGSRSPKPEDMTEFRTWCASLFAGGFVGDDWPVRWGGSGKHDALKDYITDTELADAGVPRPVGAFGLVAHALLEFGTDEQKIRYLPRIREFADMWCQLFSEPEAGSDLAALRTRARLDDEHWVIDGQKVWTTHGHIADLGFLLARTDETVSKHAGISAFIVDMSTPGIEVRPLRELTGASDFNEVFFDSVRIPAANIIGVPGQGWEIARAALSLERASALREDSVVDSAARLLELASVQGSDGRMPIDDSDVKRRLGELTARARVTDLLGLQAVVRESRGTAGPVDSAVMKVVFSEANLALATFGVELMGPEGIITAPDSDIDYGHWQEAFLWARGFTISAGSNEIMHNVIAENGLGLPREPRPESRR